MPHRTRLTATGLAAVLTLTLLVAIPAPAAAHPGQCTSAPTPVTGLAGAVLAVANVFEALLPAAPPEVCEEADYQAVQPVMQADFSAEAAGDSSGDADDDIGPTGAPCANNRAARTFPCEGIDMLSYVSHSELGTTFVNDIWGWTDPQSGKDYALVGASEGTVFVDISDPALPQVLGILPTHTTDGGDFWRDIKVYRNHAFVTSENTGHGVQVFDLTQLRHWDGSYTTYEATTRYDELGSAHNININTETGYAYAVGARGSDECGTGLHMIDVSDPASPGFAGCFDGHGYVHDTQCVVYRGPDPDYQGRELCFNSNATTSRPGGEHTVAIVDVTDKENPRSLSRSFYDTFGYSHQGWLTPDQRFFLHGDELDEVRQGVKTTTRVWDVSDVDNPVLVDVFTNGRTSIDHNMYTEGSYSYHSNYTSGLRIYRTSHPTNLKEVAYFDVYPQNDNASFEGGTWSNYPYFAQDRIVAVSSIDRGLFILRPRGEITGR